MLRLEPAPLDTLRETLLPDEVRALPDDLARADELLADAGLLEPFRAHWQRTCPGGLEGGRPTISMRMYVRLMVLKHVNGQLEVRGFGQVEVRTRSASGSSR